MSDAIKHECGIALIRLRKPYQYYIDKYQTPLYGSNKLYLMMEKQVNRGQDGAGVANIKLDVAPGHRYISRYRSVEKQAVADIFDRINKKFRKVQKSNKSKWKDAAWLQENVAFSGEVGLGHLRYGTHGENEIEKVKTDSQLGSTPYPNRRTRICCRECRPTLIESFFIRLEKIAEWLKPCANGFGDWTKRITEGE